MSEYDALPQSLRSEVPACVDPSDYTIFDRKILAAADAIEALVRERDALREALISATASLAAAISLLERSPKKGAPSNTMFDMMVSDYQKSLNRARAALTASAPTGPRNPSAE